MFNFREKSLHIAIAVVAILLISSATYSFVQMNSLEERLGSQSVEIATLKDNLASTTLALQDAIDRTHDSLSETLSYQSKNVGEIKEQLEDKVGELSGDLNTLEKLARTDRELLKKYSKVYFLNENYVPARLSEIPLKYQYSETKQLLVHSDVLPFLEKMIKAASSSGITMYVSSAYRSFDEQKALKGNYSITYGAGTANTFSADQGYSEHQLGTTVDMISPGQGGILEGFDKTESYKWLLANAHKYGFTLSYPRNNTHYVFEPWHWRFVGTELATDLHNDGKSFYDLDQRKIDEYLVNIFD